MALKDEDDLQDRIGLIISMVFLLFFAICITWGITQSCRDHWWKDRIAKHNCGEFYLDAEHNRQWRWK